ncbi:Uma2 family endonuclease [Acidisoma cellulosilytica]|uniref:Uma2 family endonuclease n=1 Tax=Acidisoma cellulosilyticum TaxID=2802395 RepID=A0A963YXG4_9PROT|nr:Uma2 family endonuclease [Acidisoma cellulosilyticum]MCB8878953.1 Uma2 family endonuclease [Acidisoma cellulosilyticum]
MNVAMRKLMTLAEFLSWENRQELRYEFDGFQPVAMTGGTAAHAGIQVNILSALATRLRGKPCRAYGSHLKIEVAGRIRYPDAFVICTPVANEALVVAEPVVVFEILSRSTAATDLFAKNAEYRATPSIQRYVILEQGKAAAMVFTREGENWLSEILTDKDVLPMPEIGIEIPLTEFYIDIDLSTPPEGDTVEV